MTAVVQAGPSQSRRLRSVLAAAWGMVSGVAPHVLHHVGPLAGAALLAGTGGRVLFFFIGLVVALPMLIRLYRRFRTWVAPAIAVVVFSAAYTASSLFLGPLLTGDSGDTGVTGVTGDPTGPASVTTTDPHGH